MSGKKPKRRTAQIQMCLDMGVNNLQERQETLRAEATQSHLAYNEALSHCQVESWEYGNLRNVILDRLIELGVLDKRMPPEEMTIPQLAAVKATEEQATLAITINQEIPSHDDLVSEARFCALVWGKGAFDQEQKRLGKKLQQPSPPPTLTSSAARHNPSF